jgi:hypothetical protein
MEQKLAYAMTLAAFGNYEQLQQTENMIAVQNGNLLANNAIGPYNGQVKRYWLNGGPANTYGFVLPGDPANLHLEQYYKPAVDATLVYDPATQTWKPSGMVLETPIWTLPPGTVLYIVEP